MKLESDRLILRRWRDGDKEPFRVINGDPRVMEYYPITLSAAESDELMERMDLNFNTHGFGLFAAEIKDTGEIIGFVGIQRVPFQAHFTPTVEIGWRISADHWGKGYAPEGARRVLEFGFKDLGLKEIVAITAPMNFKSRRVMEKIGMKYVEGGDFDNPRVPDGHALKRHVLYRILASEFK